MARRSDHNKEELEQMIFNAALELIETEGLIGLSARKIAAKISYTPGTIYSFYENLDELIFKINAETLEQIYEALEHCSNKSKSDTKTIRDLAKCYLTYAIDNHNRWKVLYEYAHPTGKLPEWYQSKIDKIFSLLESKINEVCKNSKQSKTHAQILWASLHGIAILALSGRLDTVKNKSALNLVDEFCTIFLAGIKT